ncbi:MAG: GNAT family N-acetyltransferase [Silvibacterium sp.]|jgi:ribosomal protein S18 acetylase RimI-like enzyme
MVTIERLSSHCAMHLKRVRLTALKDTPSAFSSTYARESQRSNEDWLKLASTWNSGESVFYIAMDEGAPCGMIAGKFDEIAPRRAWVLSMWVAPAHRRSGLGARLMDKVERWAQGLAICELYLHVTSNNSTAQNFYEKCGFTRTGITQPYQNDPALFEYEMAKAIQSC